MNSLLPLGEKGQGMRGQRATARPRATTLVAYVAPTDSSLRTNFDRLEGVLAALLRASPLTPCPLSPKGERGSDLASSIRDAGTAHTLARG